MEVKLEKKDFKRDCREKEKKVLMIYFITYAEVEK